MLLCYPKSPFPLGSFGPFRYQWMLHMVPNMAQTLQNCKMLLLYPEGDLCKKVTLLSISGKILFICNFFLFWWMQNYVTQLSTNFNDQPISPWCFMAKNLFLAIFEMSQHLPFLMNASNRPLYSIDVFENLSHGLHIDR